MYYVIYAYIFFHCGVTHGILISDSLDHIVNSETLHDRFDLALKFKTKYHVCVRKLIESSISASSSKVSWIIHFLFYMDMV
jgi:hypothetical protein